MITPERIEQIVWLRYPKIPLERTCLIEKNARMMARMETREMLASGNYSRSLIKWMEENDLLSL